MDLFSNNQFCNQVEPVINDKISNNNYAKQAIKFYVVLVRWRIKKIKLNGELKGSS